MGNKQKEFVVLYNPEKIDHSDVHALVDSYLSFTGIYEDFEEHCNVKVTNIDLSGIAVEPIKRLNFQKFAEGYKADVERLETNTYFLKRIKRKNIK